MTTVIYRNHCDEIGQIMMDRASGRLMGEFVCVKDAGLEEYVYTVLKLLYTVVQVLYSFRTLR